MNSLKKLFLGEQGLVVIFAAAFVIVSILVPNFLTERNMLGLLQSVVTIGIVACTMMFCLATRDFDLSVGSTVAFSGMIAVMALGASALSVGIADAASSRYMQVGSVTSQPIGHYEFCQSHRDECLPIRPVAAPARVTDFGWNVIKDSTVIPTPKKTLPFFHSIGLDIIEHPTGYPSFGELKSWDIEPGTVMNCEFLYFGHTVDPFHIESTFLVTEDGAECFQTMPEAIRVLS